MNLTILISILIGMIIMYLLIEVKNNCFLRSNSYDLLNNKIKILVRQAARWSVAAEQDKNPLIAVLHANYGAGYLWALSEIANKNQIEAAANIDYNKFLKDIVRIQDNANKNLARICPKYAPNRSYLSAIGGEG